MKGATLAALGLAVALGACGGSSKHEVQQPTGGDDDSGDMGSDTGGGDDSSNLIPEEKFDEIKQVFNAKAPMLSRCYDEQYAPKHGDTSRKGSVNVGLTIQPDGHPTDVKVLQTTFTSNKVGDCVVGMVKTWTFPTLPKALPTSHNYVLDRL